MQTTFSMLFYPRGNDIDNNGNAPIYARITVNGKRSEFSIRRKVLLTKWNSDAGKIRGTTSGVRELNNYIASIRTKINKIQEQLSENKTLVTAEKIKILTWEKISRSKLYWKFFKNIMTRSRN